MISPEVVTVATILSIVVFACIWGMLMLALSGRKK